MKPVSQITDRAKRYRANRIKPAGRKLCNFCASKKNIDVDHITGDEADGEPENLMYLCRPCNTIKGLVQKRNRIGARTRQFNPAPAGPITFSRFRHAAAILTDQIAGDAKAATLLIHQTPQKKRQEFAERIEREAAKNPPPTFGQYVHAAAMHQRGRKDEGGKVIHATPKALRSQYARKIARIKAGRR